MRKAFAILSVCCLLFITGGYHLLFQLRISEAKETMKKELLTINKSNASRFVFSSNELKSLEWENSEEFRYKDRMFDVVEMYTEGGQTSIICLSDEKETALTNDYLKTQKPASDRSSSGIILKILSTQFISSPIVRLVAPTLLEKKTYSNYLIRYSSSYSTTTTPPPRPC